MKTEGKRLQILYDCYNHHSNQPDAKTNKRLFMSQPEFDTNLWVVKRGWDAFIVSHVALEAALHFKKKKKKIHGQGIIHLTFPHSSCMKGKSYVKIHTPPTDTKGHIHP